MEVIFIIPDYNRYRFTKKELLLYILQGFIYASAIGLLFYKSILGIIVVSPIIYVNLRKKRDYLKKQRRWQLNMEFRDSLISLSAALNAGYSIENAWDEVLEELSLLYHTEAYIMKELTYLNNQIKMNMTVEKALQDFGRRSGIEDIINFSEVFATAKRTGGDMIKIIRATCNTMSDKIEIQREITTLLTGKKLEANIMKIIPFGILTYLLTFSPTLLEPLYHNLFGAVIMSFLLICYGSAFLLIDKIIQIDI